MGVQCGQIYVTTSNSKTGNISMPSSFAVQVVQRCWTRSVASDLCDCL